MASHVDAILQGAPGIRTVTGPELEELFQETEAEPHVYKKSWEEAKDDPWLIFHTSGTTGQTITPRALCRTC